MHKFWWKITNFRVKCVRITGKSMLPRFKEGSIIVIQYYKPSLRVNNYYSIRQNDLILFEPTPKQLQCLNHAPRLTVFFKRVTHLYKQTKNYNLNLTESYDVRGDNEHQSTDSRHYGVIDKPQIIGKCLFKLPFIN